MIKNILKMIFYLFEIFYIFINNILHKNSFYIISPRIVSFVFKKVIIFNTKEKLFFIQNVRNYFDINTVFQIFGYEEYKLNSIDVWKKKIDIYYKKYKSNSLIIDCGSNIGSSSKYFSLIYPQSNIISVEPNKENFILAKKNIKSKKIIMINNAVASSNLTYQIKNKQDPRAHQILINKNKSKSRTITISQLLKKYKKFKPFIIKIDIEGFENNLFKKNIEWMDKFKIIIIEIHDWMIPSKSISNNLVNSLAKISKKNKRDLIIQGENLISIKIN